MSPLAVSVVIPLHNKELSIQRAIRSVLAQTHQNFELVIVDDGSTDQSLMQARAIHDERIRIVEQRNLGVSAARNQGVRSARFNHVAFLDADDEWEDEFLEKMSSLAAIYPDCGLYASSYLVAGPDGKVSNPDLPYPTGTHHLIKDIFFDLRMYYPFNSSSVMVNKALLMKVGGFPEDVRAGEDVITWMKLGLASKIAFINIPLSIYHHDAENRAMLNLYPEDVYAPVKFLLGAAERNDIPSEYQASVNEFIAKHQLSSAKRLIRNGRHRDALPLLWSCRRAREQKKVLIKSILIAILCFVFPRASKII